MIEKNWFPATSKMTAADSNKICEPDKLYTINTKADNSFNCEEYQTKFKC